MFTHETQRLVDSIQFGLFSPEEIKKGSVVHIIHPETVENGIPKENGLIDLRMGTTERNFLCQTCNGSSFDCAGHYGHIELSKPMFHIGYMHKIKKTLECVCFYCSKIKISKSKLESGLDSCWSTLKSKMICDGDVIDTGKTGCGNKQPMIKKEGLSLIAFMKEDDDNEGKVVLNGEKVYNILKKIPEEDYMFLGFSKEFCKPEWMVLSVIVVAPPCVRPSIVMNGHLRGEDDLTHKLSDIVKANSYLKKYEQEGAPGHIIRDYEQLLQFHLATLVDNELGGQPQALQKSGRPLKSISARLKGKEGRVRGNLMGKRVDFSARSVISPDPNISLQEIGVPEAIAKIHTFPEKVNSFNMDYLQNLVRRGPHEYPGANYVIRSDGQRIDLSFNRHELKLEKGFTVERHMRDGDEILFNRQPSLHKMSMMGHKARIMPGKSFRLNLSATTPYNADFDGDEMNLHMPQSYPSKSELRSIISVDRHIVSPQSNKPVIGIVQDTLIGSHIFTIRDTFFNREEAMNLLYNISSFGKKDEDFLNYMKPTIIQPVELWTGKQIFSAILPPIYYSRKSNSGNSYKSIDENNLLLLDEEVIIKNGILLAGSVDKESIGTKQGGIIHIIYNDFGSNAARQFIDNVQKLVVYFLLHISSFSVGIGDCIANSETLRMCRNVVEKSLVEVDDLITQTKRNELEKLPGMTIYNTFESRVNVVLNKARNIASTADVLVSHNNNMMGMVLAGSKGSFINISQITTCMGQQNVEGRRIPFGFNERCLPHFYKYDYTAKSRGFVENSYLTGMNPHEFFFHAMGGREGIIDTSIKTAETGYIQRRLVKALEDATAHHDYSVRNANGNIIQFLYGDDSFDAVYLENVTVDLTDFKNKFFIDMFGDSNFSISSSQVSAEVYEILREDLDLQMKLDLEYEYLINNKNLLKNSFASPVNISRIISKIMFLSKNPEHKTISPFLILETLDSLMTDNLKLNYYIRISLNFKFVLLNLSLDDFNTIVEEIRTKILKVKINANEMVGTLAAQSVGEPATQMTLNTFHLAGVASTHSQGVPRLNEIINLSKSIKSPFMKIFLKDQVGFNLESARMIQNRIEFLSLKMICNSCQILYDPDPRSTVVKEDRDFVSAYFEMPDDEVDFDSLTKIVIRLEISRSLIVSKGLSLDFLSRKIKESFTVKTNIITSDENDERLIVRVRFVATSANDTLNFYYDCKNKILKTHLQGITQIKKAHISSHTVDGLSEYFLITDGISFSRVLSEEGVDGTRVVPNDILSVYNILGVEAARQSILNELCAVLEGSTYVNIRHMALLADVMTIRGFLTGITRHGVSKESSSALKRASFEETVDVFLDAAAHSELDQAKGVSENIMLGQLAPIGTGIVDLMLDIKKLEHLLPNKNLANGDEEVLTPDNYSLDDLSGYSPAEEYDFSSISNMSGGFSPNVHSYSASSTYVQPMSAAYSSAVIPGNNYSTTAHSKFYSPASPGNNPLSASFNTSSYNRPLNDNLVYNPMAYGNDYRSAMSSAYSSELSNNAYQPYAADPKSFAGGYSPSQPKYSPMSTKYNEDEEDKKNPNN